MKFSIQFLLIALSLALNQSMSCLGQSEETIKSWCRNTKYVLVMDAGSVTTKMNVYEFNVSAGNEIVLSKSNSKYFKIRLSYYAKHMDELEDLREYLNDLISLSKWYIFPNQCKRFTPILLKATNLHNVDEKIVEKLLSEVRDVFSKSGFVFKHDQVGLLNGDDEALYAWVSANFEFKTLETRRQKSSESLPRPTYGVLELGGGSTQVAFVPTSGIDTLESDCVMDFKTDVQKYTLYRHSYPTKGIDEFKFRMFNVSDECRAGQCDGEIYTSECLHPEYEGQLEYGPSKIAVHGKPYNGPSRFHHCMKLAQSMVSDVEDYTNTAKGVPFIGTRGFYYLYNNMRQIERKGSKDSYNATLRQIYSDTEKACNSPVVKNEIDRFTEVHKAVYLCMDLSYVVALLSKYGFGMDTSFILTRGESWPLGLVIQSLI